MIRIQEYLEQLGWMKLSRCGWCDGAGRKKEPKCKGIVVVTTGTGDFYASFANK